MKLYNRTKMIYQESFIDKDGNVKFINLEPNKTVEVDEKLAEKWLKIDGVEEYIDPEKAKKEEAKLKAEIEQLKAENDKLKTPKAKAKSKK